MPTTWVVRLTAIACILAPISSCADESVEPIPVPSSIAIASGNWQAGIMAAQLPLPLAVRVTGADRQPLPNVAVEFTVTSGGGSVENAFASTDANGLASTTWTLGSGASATSQSVGAQFVEFSRPHVSFSASAAAIVLKVLGDSQVGEVAEALARDPTVVVHDAVNAPVAGLAVDWKVSSGRGAVSSSQSITDASGHASVSWTLGPTVGASLQVLEAGAGGTAVTSFTASGILTAGSITLLHGDGQSGYAGLMLTPSPSVFVRTPAPSAQLVAGVVVDWSVLAGGGSISADRVFTNAAGVSSVDWTLGSSLGVGSQGLRASVPGLAAPEVTFQATAVARPASIVKVSGDLQTGTMGTALPQPLQVRVLDTSGAPMEGVQLEWDHGYVTLDDWFAKHAFQSNTTDAVGEASIMITLKGEIASDSAEAVRAYVVDAKDVVATFWLNVLTDPSGTAGATAGDRWLIDSP